MTRIRLAPSAVRMAISRDRFSEWASIRLAAFAHEIKTTRMPTAMNASQAGCVRLPRYCSLIGTTRARTCLLVAGCADASCADDRFDFGVGLRQRRSRRGRGR